MFAILSDGGKQYRVEPGQTVFLERKEQNPGDRIELTDVLYLERDGDIRVGQPTVPGARVVAQVIEETKGPKLIFHRFRKRKGSRTRFGHRQKYTQVRVESIDL